VEWTGLKDFEQGIQLNGNCGPYLWKGSPWKANQMAEAHKALSRALELNPTGSGQQLLDKTQPNNGESLAGAWIALLAVLSFFGLSRHYLSAVDTQVYLPILGVLPIHRFFKRNSGAVSPCRSPFTTRRGGSHKLTGLGFREFCKRSRSCFDLRHHRGIPDRFELDSHPSRLLVASIFALAQRSSSGGADFRYSPCRALFCWIAVPGHRSAGPRKASLGGIVGGVRLLYHSGVTPFGECIWCSRCAGRLATRRSACWDCALGFALVVLLIFARFQPDRPNPALLAPGGSAWEACSACGPYNWVALEVAV